MKFKSTINVFSELLNLVTPIVPQKSTILVLQYLHFELVGNELKVMATNDEISILTKIEVEGEQDGAILFPAKKLSEIIKLLGKDTEIVISADLEIYEITLKYNKGKFKFKGIDPLEYVDVGNLFDKPMIDVSNLSQEIAKGELVAKLHSGMIQNICERTLFAVSTEEYKLSMTGVLFQFRSNQLITAATDGYRLNKYTITLDETTFPELFDVIIPAHSLEFLKKINSEMVMSVIREDESPKYLRFEFQNTIFTTRIISEKYPPYETIIPLEYQYKVFAPLNEMVNTIKRVSLSANDISKLVILQFKDNIITATSQDEESGESAEESLPCEMSFDSFEIGVNYNYFLQSLQHLYYEGAQEDVVEIRFNDPLKAFVICPKDQYDTFLMLNMPVRYK
jgi:DNA polymerase-3 subunit beta